MEKNSFSIAAKSIPFASASCCTNVPTPSDAVGPGSTLFTVTPVPESVSASPRAMDSCAVLVIP